MILTVTPNPSLDRTYEIPTLERGAVLRATADRIDPGGKGVNVSRAVAAAGHRTLAVLPSAARRARRWAICWRRRASRSRAYRWPGRPGRTSPPSNRTAP